MLVLGYHAATSISCSAISSSLFGGECGQRESASAASCWEPFCHLAVNLYAMIRVRNRCSRGFSISSKRWVLSMGMRGLWSVMTVNWSIPARKVWHFWCGYAKRFSIRCEGYPEFLSRHCAHLAIEDCWEFRYELFSCWCSHPWVGLLGLVDSTTLGWLWVVRW